MTSRDPSQTKTVCNSVWLFFPERPLYIVKEKNLGSNRAILMSDRRLID